MVLQIIGAGLPRTGTSSLKAALERLGFGPCYHMFELMRNPEQVQRWRPLGDGASVDWAQVFDGYSSALDWPASYFWRDLADAYPDAKLILTVRDPHRWYASIAGTILNRVQSTESTPPEPFASLLPLLNRISEGTFGTSLPDEKQAVEAFQQHTADVQRAIPADRLLTFEAGHGWEPLCDFLGVDPPADEPFPHLNDAETMRRMFQHAQTHDRLVTPFDEQV